MKTLILILLIPGLLIAIVRSELTPWRLFSPSEVAALRDRIALLEQQAQRTSATSAGSSQPGWIRDPSYRTSLEKTTVVGVPESSKRRER